MIFFISFPVILFLTGALAYTIRGYKLGLTWMLMSIFFTAFFILLKVEDLIK